MFQTNTTYKFLHHNGAERCQPVGQTGKTQSEKQKSQCLPIQNTAYLGRVKLHLREIAGGFDGLDATRGLGVLNKDN